MNTSFTTYMKFCPVGLDNIISEKAFIQMIKEKRN